MPNPDLLTTQLSIRVDLSRDNLRTISDLLTMMLDYEHPKTVAEILKYPFFAGMDSAPSESLPAVTAAPADDQEVEQLVLSFGSINLADS